ncbi:MAG TPA: nitroreductase [Steroidobacteraceae bacterium]|jgi:nitroreductase|nr:nitroreductase [Steroidobacteraceae bacterium]
METIEALNSRATAKTYGLTAPTKEHLAIALQAAVRAPDHGRLRPWRFMLIEGDQRRKLGEMLAASALRRVPGLGEGDVQRERDKALRAPLIIVVACRIVSGTKIPAIEQLMAAGAAAQNILLALHALGYVAAWKTGEAAYDTEVKKSLGLAADDHLVAFIYTGGGAGATFAAGKAANVQDAMLEFPEAR